MTVLHFLGGEGESFMVFIIQAFMVPSDAKTDRAKGHLQWSTF